MESSGATKTNTDNFTVVGRWTIALTVKGGAGVNVSIKDAASGRTVDYFSVDAGENVSQQRRSGTFFLEISPYGSSYTLVVTDIPG